MQPFPLVRERHRFDQVRGLPAAEDLGFNHGDAVPSPGELSVDAVVEETVFSCSGETSLSAEALVAVIPEVPLALDEEVKGADEPLEG